MFTPYSITWIDATYTGFDPKPSLDSYRPTIFGLHQIQLEGFAVCQFAHML